MSGNAAFQSKDEYKYPKCVMFGSWQVMLIVVR